MDTAKFEGDLAILPMQNFWQTLGYNTTHPTDLRVMFSSVSADNCTLVDGFNIGVVLDSGTSYGVFPDPIIQAIGDAIGYTYDETSSFYQGSCNDVKLDTITIELGGEKFDVPVSNLLDFADNTKSTCQLAIQSGGNPQPGSEDTYSTIMGDVFLRSLYVVYDLSNYQIGLGKAISDASDSSIQALSSTIPGTSASAYSSTTATWSYSTYNSCINKNATSTTSTTLSSTALISATPAPTGTCGDGCHSPGTFYSSASSLLNRAVNVIAPLGNDTAYLTDAEIQSGFKDFEHSIASIANKTSSAICLTPRDATKLILAFESALNGYDMALNTYGVGAYTSGTLTESLYSGIVSSLDSVLSTLYSLSGGSQDSSNCPASLSQVITKLNAEIDTINAILVINVGTLGSVHCKASDLLPVGSCNITSTFVSSSSSPSSTTLTSGTITSTKSTASSTSTSSAPVITQYPVCGDGCSSPGGGYSSALVNMKKFADTMNSFPIDPQRPADSDVGRRYYNESEVYLESAESSAQQLTCLTSYEAGNLFAAINDALKAYWLPFDTFDAAVIDLGYVTVDQLNSINFSWNKSLDAVAKASTADVHSGDCPRNLSETIMQINNDISEVYLFEQQQMLPILNLDCYGDLRSSNSCAKVSSRAVSSSKNPSTILKSSTTPQSSLAMPSNVSSTPKFTQSSLLSSGKPSMTPQSSLAMPSNVSSTPASMQSSLSSAGRPPTTSQSSLVLPSNISATPESMQSSLSFAGRPSTTSQSSLVMPSNMSSSPTSMQTSLSSAGKSSIIFQSSPATGSTIKHLSSSIGKTSSAGAKTPASSSSSLVAKSKYSSRGLSSALSTGESFSFSSSIAPSSTDLTSTVFPNTASRSILSYFGNSSVPSKYGSISHSAMTSEGLSSEVPPTASKVSTWLSFYPSSAESPSSSSGTPTLTSSVSEVAKLSSGEVASSKPSSLLPSSSVSSSSTSRSSGAFKGSSVEAAITSLKTSSISSSGVAHVYGTTPSSTQELSTFTTVVSSFTTWCPSSTEITTNGKTYTATEPTTLTITDCPCTLRSASPTSNSRLSEAETYTSVVSAFTTWCPSSTEIVTNGETYTVTEPTTLTITDCPCTITSTGTPPSPSYSSQDGTKAAISASMTEQGETTNGPSAVLQVSQSPTESSLAVANGSCQLKPAVSLILASLVLLLSILA